VTTYSLDIIIKAIDQASANLKTVGSSLGTLGKDANNAAQALQPLGVGLAALGATGAALIGTAAMTAARVQVLGTVLETVGGNAGYSAIELAGFEASLMASGITAGASRQALIQMAQAEIDLSHSTDLARLAQDAAVIANLNSSDAYERLITGIQRGQPILLRTMGITVDFQGAYKRMAAQLGKTTAELTSNEKMQARVNEVMKAGTAISGVYEDAMGDVGKKLGSVKGDIQDAANALGQAYLPAMEGAVDATRDALDWFTQLDAGTQRNIATFLGLGTAVTGTAGAIILATPKIIQMGSSVATLAGFASNTGFALKLLGAGATTSGLGMAGAAASAIALAIPLAALGVMAGAAYLAISNLHYTSEQAAGSMRDFTDVSAILNPELAYLQETTDAAAGSARDLYVETGNLADGWTSQYSPALIEARTYTDGWATSMELASQPLGELGERVEDTTRLVNAHISEMGMLAEALEGPVSQANEQYTAEQVRISHELIEARKRLKELGKQHGDYDDEIAETEATLKSLEGELVSLDAQHRAVMNQVVYDMMMARLATEGWTSAETELAIETARAMGIIDEETWAAATSMNGALDSFADGESVDNTVNAILGIGEEISGLGPTADEIGAGIGVSLEAGAEAGITAFEKVNAAIAAVPKTIDITTNYRSTGTPPWEQPGGGAEEYQHGTDYVPRTGWAYLHRGEAVLPAQVAAQYRAGDTNINLTANYAHQSERHLRDDVRMMQLMAGA